MRGWRVKINIFLINDGNNAKSDFLYTCPHVQRSLIPMYSTTIFMEGIPNPDPLDLIVCLILIFYSLKKYLNRVYVKPCSSYLG